MLKVIKVSSIAVLLATTGCLHAKANYNTAESQQDRLAKVCQPYINIINTYASTGDTQAHLDYYNVKNTKEFDMCLSKYPKLSQAIKEANKTIEQKNLQAAQDIKNKYK